MRDALTNLDGLSLDIYCDSNWEGPVEYVLFSINNLHLSDTESLNMDLRALSRTDLPSPLNRFTIP